MQKLTEGMFLLFMPVAFVHAGPIFEGIDKSRNIVRCDGNDKGISNDSHHTNALQDTMPDSWTEREEWSNYMAKCNKKKIAKIIYKIYIYI